MNKQIDISVIEKAKKILQIENEMSSIELLKLLKDYRKRIHPDNFIEDSARNEAEEKFKELGCLIDDLNHYIENEKLHRSAMELALYEPIYDNVSLETKVDEAAEKIIELEEQVTDLKEENTRLKETLNKKEDAKLEKENLELKQLYKPSKQKLASLGILFILSSTLAVMTKIEQFSIILRKYSPISEIILNNLVFGLFVIMLIVVAKQYIENKLISLKVGEVCSPKFSMQFWQYLNALKEWEEKKAKDFTEGDVFAFIYGRESKFKRLLSALSFKMYQIETVDRLKNHFINTLLNKQLITISLASGLDRAFIIKEGYRRYYFFDDD